MCVGRRRESNWRTQGGVGVSDVGVGPLKLDGEGLVRTSRPLQLWKLNSLYWYSLPVVLSSRACGLNFLRW